MSAVQSNLVNLSFSDLWSLHQYLEHQSQQRGNGYDQYDIRSDISEAIKKKIEDLAVLS